MREHEDSLHSPEDHDELKETSLVDTLSLNARRFGFSELAEIVQQYAEQKGKTKIDIDAPGYGHVITTIAELLKFEDPEITEVRIPSSELQSTLTAEPDYPGQAPTLGNLPVGNETVQLRLDHVYVLLGAGRHISSSIGPDTILYEQVSRTSLAKDIFAIEERTESTVAVRVVRRDRLPYTRRRIRARRNK
jgi:hypothetical protein